MKLNTDNKPDKHSQHNNEPDKVLEKLEEMWDRKILKGDDDYFESRNRSGVKSNSTDNTELLKSKRKRRGRIM